jgi:osomolarity two-component system sensor histidine kinase SLN1
MAPDATLIQTSQAGSISSTRSTSALHSLMEQGMPFNQCTIRLALKLQSGGRVELSLHNHDSHSLVHGGTLSCKPGEPAQTSKPQSPHPGQESPPKHRSSERPTFVPLPEPATFAVDMNSDGGQSSPLLNPDFGISNNQESPLPTPCTIPEHSLNVLVVDDDQLTRTLMTRMLSRMGCHVSTAENGELALEMILGIGSTPSSSYSSAAGPILERPVFANLETKYAIVFLDNQMPVMSGLKAVQKLRDLGRQDLVVGVTGKTVIGFDTCLNLPCLKQGMHSSPIKKNTWKPVPTSMCHR